MNRLKVHCAVMAVVLLSILTACDPHNNPNHPIVGIWLSYDHTSSLEINDKAVGEPIHHTFKDDKPDETRLKLDITYKKKGDVYTGSLLTYSNRDKKWSTVATEEFTLSPSNDIVFKRSSDERYKAHVNSATGDKLDIDMEASGKLKDIISLMPTLGGNSALEGLFGGINSESANGALDSILNGNNPMNELFDKFKEFLEGGDIENATYRSDFNCVFHRVKK